MAVSLTIVKSPTGVAANPQQKAFGPEGGLIGRGASNDWVLTDPERFLSSKHCRISKQGDAFYLTDLSTNGTFVNGASEPLGRGNSAALREGDRIDLGEYRFQVSLQTEQADDFPASPFGAAPSLEEQNDFGVAESLVAAEHPRESMYMSREYGDDNQGSVAGVIPDDMKVADPLLALGGDVPQSDGFADLIGSGSQEDSADLLRESADWPEARSEDPLLPEDWDQDISLLGNRQKAPAGNRSRRLATDDSLIVRKAAKAEAPKEPEAQQPLRERPRKPSPAPTPKPQQPAPAARPAPAMKAQSKASPPSSGAAGGNLFSAMGLQDEDLSADQAEEVSALVGGMMRETINGLLQVMRSRASIKNEFRMNVTTIQPVENNPIKFSANVDEVLELMFLKRSHAYKEPVAAIEESFDAIADHQVAMIAGIRSAFRALMSKFDPLLLEEEFKQSGKAGIFPPFRKGKYWNAYQEQYQQMINNLERSFQEMFGDEFVQAYEDQLRKLAAARDRQ